MKRLFLFLCLFFAACDSGGKGSSCPKSQPLSPALLAEYRRMEECTGMTAPPPEVVFKKTVPCPTTGRMGCIEGRKPYPCPAPMTGLCGSSGEYDDECKVAVLPDQDTASFAHEAVHHLLWKNRKNADRQHKDPLFQKCG